MEGRSGRQNVSSWDETFMGIARVVSGRSKDPNCQVGACIVSEDNKIISIGYNCMPRNQDALFDHWDNRETKNEYVCHAELNAITNADRKDFTGCRMYVTRIPCGPCAQLIIQNNIKEVYYVIRRHPITESMFDRLAHQGFVLTRLEDPANKDLD